MHLQESNVILIGELVKAPVGDNLSDLPINVAVCFVGIQHVVLPDSHQKVAWGDVLKRGTDDVKSNLSATLTQCAAVMAHLEEIRVAPHPPILVEFFLVTMATHGYLPR